jgi:hypothetical protein
MDGTLANLYAVENWLPMLRAEDPKPYAEAAVLLNMNVLARKLNKLQAQGHEIVVISWLAKVSTENYDKAVTEAKKAWLKKHLGSVKFDEINIVKYGTPKSLFCESADDVLFDDEAPNRENWNGKAYDVHNIIQVLGTL